MNEWNLMLRIRQESKESKTPRTYDNYVLYFYNNFYYYNYNYYYLDSKHNDFFD